MPMRARLWPVLFCMIAGVFLIPPFPAAGASVRGIGNHIDDPNWPELESDATGALELLHIYWSRTFPVAFGDYGSTWIPLEANGYYEPSDPPFCGQNRVPANNANYCFVDNPAVPGVGQLSFDVMLFLTLIGGLPGDTSIYVVLAHEYGHAVQHRTAAPLPGQPRELQADCYSGAFLEEVVRTGELVLEDGDIQEIGQILIKMSDAVSSPWVDPALHGSLEERGSSFLYGVQNGPRACLDFPW